MGNKEEKKNLIHSLTGNTNGNNNTQTVVSILNQTRPVSQSVNSNQNQSKKEGE